MQPKDKRVIEKIIHRIKLILQYCEGIDYDQFYRTSMISEACVFNLLQIGEMCNRDLSDVLGCRLRLRQCVMEIWPPTIQFYLVRV